jgi:hypothetical protein
MPSAFSNPAWQPVLIPYVGQTPTDDYLRQTPHFGPWSRVYWHLVWSQIHARDLHRALFWVQVWASPPRCLTRDVAQYLLIPPDEWGTLPHDEDDNEDDRAGLGLWCGQTAMTEPLWRWRESVMRDGGEMLLGGEKGNWKREIDTSRSLLFDSNRNDTPSLFHLDTAVCLSISMSLMISAHGWEEFCLGDAFEAIDHSAEERRVPQVRPNIWSRLVISSPRRIRPTAKKIRPDGRFCSLASYNVNNRSQTECPYLW